MAGVGGIAAFKQLERQARQHQRELQDRQARREARTVRNRAQATCDAPVEALACPSCLDRYGFGDTCPHCDVALEALSQVPQGVVGRSDRARRPRAGHACPRCMRTQAAGGPCARCTHPVLDLGAIADRAEWESLGTTRRHRLLRLLQAAGILAAVTGLVTSLVLGL